MLSWLSKDLRKKMVKNLKPDLLEKLDEEYEELLQKREKKVVYLEWVKLIGIFLLILLVIESAAYISLTLIQVEKGTFGDFFNGIISPFISIGALTAAYLAYKSQSSQLDLQQKEVKLQRFENHFFQLLGLHNDIVKSMTYDEDGFDQPINGREYFNKIYEKLIRIYNNNPNPKNKYSTMMNEIDKGENDQLLHYFRNLYQIFKLIERNSAEFDQDELKQYVDIIRAQLTPNEIAILYFNTRYYGKDDFDETLQNFNFFRDGFTPESIEDSFKQDAANRPEKKNES
ncbi:putative phage abortive infection protein [Mesobacillus maritimus]|uniref:putative phage abortive infection protein n=1 Tax=Mesobacillus maritimus TaxID=1643336 RepID=UPI00203BAA68|nr:putative phage abortive infection protein [Mesobacillus maritimus]MCM3587012.1 putative phage abortive infection protein [Mesobacillus maritimus]